MNAQATPDQAAAARMMLELGIDPREVATALSDAMKRPTSASSASEAARSLHSPDLTKEATDG